MEIEDGNQQASPTEKGLGDGPELPEKELGRSRVGSTGETRRDVFRVAGAAAAGAASLAGGGMGLGAHAGSALPGPGVAAAATGAAVAVWTGTAAGLDALSGEAKRVLALATDEAQRLRHKYIGTEHLLLGLVRAGGSRTPSAAGDAGTLNAVDTTTRMGAAGAGGAGLIASPASAPQIRRAGADGTLRDRKSTLDGFARFSQRAKQVLVRAHEEARRLDHAYLGTEHVLLGLLRVEGGVAAVVLAELAITPEMARSAVVRLAGRGDRMVTGPITRTPRFSRVMDLSVDEAKRLRHESVDTEHLLLALIREADGVAVQILKERGAGVEEVRQRVLRTISSQPNAARNSHD